MLKDMVRIGCRWFNPSTITLIECGKGPTPNVKVHIAGHDGLGCWELIGDEAECLLECLGYGEKERAAEAKKKAKEQADAEAAVQEEANKAAKEAAKAEKAHSHAHASK